MSTQIRELQEQVSQIFERLTDIEGDCKYFKRVIQELDQRVKKLETPPPPPPPAPAPAPAPTEPSKPVGGKKLSNK